MDYTRIGKNVADIRAKRQLSQEQLADRAHVSKAFICQVEASQKKPRLETLVSIAEALNTTVDNILNNESLQTRYDEIAKIIENCNEDELRLIAEILRTLCSNLKNGKIVK